MSMYKYEYMYDTSTEVMWSLQRDYSPDSETKGTYDGVR